jgi:hypothetical protein
MTFAVSTSASASQLSDVRPCGSSVRERVRGRNTCRSPCGPSELGSDQQPIPRLGRRLAPGSGGGPDFLSSPESTLELRVSHSDRQRLTAGTGRDLHGGQRPLRGVRRWQWQTRPG